MGSRAPTRLPPPTTDSIRLPRNTTKEPLLLSNRSRGPSPFSRSLPLFRDNPPPHCHLLRRRLSFSRTRDAKHRVINHRYVNWWDHNYNSLSIYRCDSCGAYGHIRDELIQLAPHMKITIYIVAGLIEQIQSEINPNIVRSKIQIQVTTIKGHL